MILSTIKNRRSIRNYKSDPINDDQIRELLKAAAFAPSSKHNHSIEYIVLKNPKNKEKSLYTSRSRIPETSSDPDYSRHRHSKVTTTYSRSRGRIRKYIASGDIHAPWFNLEKYIRGKTAGCELTLANTRKLPGNQYHTNWLAKDHTKISHR